ncbi:MAG: DNA polymerase III subunit delta [Pirellulales bacterium]
MSQRIHIFDYLEAPREHRVEPVCVLFGAEPFLKRLARAEIQRAVLGDDEEGLFTTLDGNQVDWRDVVDEISTVPLFGGDHRRLVFVDDADDFVGKYRDRLERYVAKPRRKGVLVLDVDAWPANTRLYKLVDKSGLPVECRAPEKLLRKRKVLDEARLCHWLRAWSKQQHQASLDEATARQLLELVGPDVGLLDQDLAKLALFAGPEGTITTEMVRDIVGGWRATTTWDLIDAAADGNAAEALQQLDRFLQSGEHPLALLGQVSWSLRRFAAATRIFEEAERRGDRTSLRGALEQAGFPKWPKALEKAERQLKQIGRQRAGSIYRWLLDADLAMKGTHSAPHRARFVLEQLLLRLAKQASPPRAAARK